VKTTLSRGQQKEEAGLPPGLPELSGYEGSLVEAFQESGMTKCGMAGEIPLEWGDVNHFATATGLISSQWERGTLFHMSKHYLIGRGIGEDQFGIEPVELEEGEAA